jgi:hypothetical protein
MKNREVKIRIQGDEKLVEIVRQYLLASHPGLILARPREGTNPKYAENQKWSCYGNIQFSVLTNRTQKEKKRIRRS